MAHSFAFIPRVVKKKNIPPVSSPASLSIGAQVTSESIFPHPVRGTKDIASGSESIKNIKKIDYDEHASRSASGTETKPSQPTTSITARKDLIDSEDLAQLVCLALSDYAIWADVDLRRKIDWGSNKDPCDDNNGYIPLAYLLQHSQVFRLVPSSSSIINQPHTTFIKAIRAHASHLIDVRLIIPSSSSSVFPRYNTVPWDIQTGYELRRKQASSTLSKHGKKEWDALTIYVENIPSQYRSIPGIIKFLNGLLPPSSSSSVLRIQNIFLPAHHQDEPGSIPICKCFALVTLSHDEDVSALFNAYPWDLPTEVMNSARLMKLDVTSATAKTKGKGKDKESSIEEISPFQVEATKFGLRVLSKAKWEGLRAEYLCYHQQLVDEINTYQDEGQSEVHGGGRKRRYLDEIHDQEEEQITEEDSNQTQGVYIQSQSSKNTVIPANNLVISTASIYPNSAYPPGCLVFVRNVHSDTNKTTLRSLFLHARRSSVECRVESGKKDDGGLDYLDYTKGMDCCHVRLRTPLHARQLVHHLSSNPIVQSSGLDASGTSFAQLSSSGKDNLQPKPVMAEQVLGKREEIYWAKVPEKIRRQAAEKAISSRCCDTDSTLTAGPSMSDTKKKRAIEGDQTHSVDLDIHVNSAYPPGCLVFIRHVHPETNKTTLRNLFLHAQEETVKSGDSDGKKDEDGIDYLDYTKGMDCCYVRLRTPLHAQQLVRALCSNSIVQTVGLDASGSRLVHLDASSSDNRIEDNAMSTPQLKPIAAEQILGKREEVYWEKVSEKVRREAVEKALSYLHGSGECGVASSVHMLEGNKKRRKK